MNSVITQLLDLFDNLDAYESQELQEELAYRGYELKINREIKKSIKPKIKYGLFLKGFNDNYKISTIKLIRNLYQEHKDFLDEGIKHISLIEAKEFVDDQDIWPKMPILIGKESELERIKTIIQSDYESVFWVIKEVDEYFRYNKYQTPPDNDGILFRSRIG